MNPPTLEYALVVEGDTLARIAWLLGGDEAAVNEILQATARSGWRSWDRGADQPALIAALFAATQQWEERERERGRSRRGGEARDPLFRRIMLLPLEQRLALALRLLLGYNLERSTHALRMTPEAVHAAYRGAIRAIAPTAKFSISDVEPTPECSPNRRLIESGEARDRRDPGLRAHLAGCSACRAFDNGWQQTERAADSALRNGLRDRIFPQKLLPRLLLLARPPLSRIAAPQARLVVLPLAILLALALLVLPGFLRNPTTVVTRSASNPPVDPRALVEEARIRLTEPPEQGNGIWHATYRTLWYFQDDVIAPLQGEVWIDRANAARHRIQIAHADGGAPYELQIGNGRDRLYYALDPIYASALYGEIGATADTQPFMLNERMSESDQTRARQIRLSSGAWAIGEAYLRQAAAAPNLRSLGRQRSGNQTVQIISFTSPSPLSAPPDATDTIIISATILLAIDLDDGRLRRVVELSGPTGSAQTSRTTWELIEEEWLFANDTIAAAFDPARAWTGLGQFPVDGGEWIGDLAVPAIPRGVMVSPARLLDTYSGAPLWLPNALPAGTDRGLLLWSRDDLLAQAPPRYAIYLGTGRMLRLQFQSIQFAAPARPNSTNPTETLLRPPWTVDLTPLRPRRYHLTLLRLDTPAGLVTDPSMIVTIEAHGFTRAELLAVIESLQPADSALIASQAPFFVAP